MRADAVAVAAAGPRRRVDAAGAALLYARLALGAAFLSAVGARLGLWGHGWAAFVRYCGEVNAFLPRAVIPAVAVAATALELGLGLALVAGVGLRHAARGAALLLAGFAIAMAISFGPKEPLDYSVPSASAAAWLVDVLARARAAAPPAGRAAASRAR